MFFTLSVFICLRLFLQETPNDRKSEKSTTEGENETVDNNKEEIKAEEEEEENENNEEDEDVQSFVTAADNENDISEAVNDLHLGHDDDGKNLDITIFIQNLRFLIYFFSKYRLDNSIKCSTC